MCGTKAVLIYLAHGVVLSKKPYRSWQEIQAEYREDYITSLAPMTCEETICFFKDDFGEETDWPFSRRELVHFFESDSERMKSGETA